MATGQHISGIIMGKMRCWLSMVAWQVFLVILKNIYRVINHKLTKGGCQLILL
jgi:hypothetical protein